MRRSSLPAAVFNVAVVRVATLRLALLCVALGLGGVSAAQPATAMMPPVTARREGRSPSSQ